MRSPAEALEPDYIDQDPETEKPIYNISPEKFAEFRHAGNAVKHCAMIVTTIGKLIVYADMKELENDWYEIGDAMATLGELIEFLSDLSIYDNVLPREAQK